jgi:formylglycine-generating enzyme required for sulfatase activity
MRGEELATRSLVDKIAVRSSSATRGWNGISFAAGVRRFLLTIVCAAAMLALAPVFAASGAETDGAAGDSPVSTGTQTDSKRPSKVYESVFGYIEGMHRKPDEPRADKRKTPRFKHELAKAASSGESEGVRAFRAEETRARRLIERKEWDMAQRSVDRAMDLASRVEPPGNALPLRDMLQTARANESGQVKSPPSGEIANSIGMKLVLIPPGTFIMGTSADETRRVEGEWETRRETLEPEGPAHTVKISAPFMIGKYEVTVGQFKVFVNETGYQTVAEKQGWGWVFDKEKRKWIQVQGSSWKNPGMQVHDDHPATLVCHKDAEAFCKWLSAKDRRQYFLPTEAQWEYASRGGKEEERFPWGDSYPDGRKLNLADKNSPLPWADRTFDDGWGKLAPVGSYDPNGHYLYDTAGNVWELCSDVYSAKAFENSTSRVSVDPSGPTGGKKRVVKGGNWAFGACIARNGFRFGVGPEESIDVTGFRVAAAADKDAAGPARTDEGAAGANLPPDQKFSRIVDQVKGLAASGRRLEARRVAEKFLDSLGKDSAEVGKPVESAAKLLDAVIDLTQSETLESFTNFLGMKMVRIPAGSFVMGSSQIDVAWALSTLARDQPVQLENESPFHKVRISRPFHISTTEVTVKQYRAFVEETGYVTDAEDAGGGEVFNVDDARFRRKTGATWKNPGWTVEDSQPVAMISYFDAQAFCEWLSAKERLPYKLPTEAQWEYAARGGRPMAHFPWGDALPDGRKANFADKNTDYEWRDRYVDDGYKYVAPVGSYEANGFGLYDMAGNVLEWVRDYYGEDYYRFSPEIDPEGPGHGENRVMKGGEWTFGPVNLRCSFRGWARPELAFQNSGFRVAIDFTASRRPYDFADNFLTREWVPKPDQREVASAVAKEKERQALARKAQEKQAVAGDKKAQDGPLIQGLKILTFSPKSDGKDAGLEKGDVIVEYKGVRDLTAARFLALTAETKKRREKPTLVFVRDGYEYSITTLPGFLGVAVINTRIKGPFKKREAPLEREREDKQQGRKDWT